MTITPERVLAALRHVDDPDLKRDLVSLNMIRDLAVDGHRVAFTVMLTTPACPMKEAIRSACENAVKLLVSAEAEVEVRMSAEVTSQARGGGSLPNVRNVIGISSGKGGVGKSTVAANVAVALARAGARVGLVDADIYGPSVPILFGFSGQRPEMATVQGRDMLVPFERHGVKLMSIGTLVDEAQAIVWRGPMASKALRQLVFDTDWGEIDYLLVDLPPGTGDVHLTLVQALAVTGVVVVTTPQRLAVADARKGAQMFQTPQINVPILGVVENMSYFVPDDAPEKRYAIFGAGGGAALAAATGSPLLAQLPMLQSIMEGGDAGMPSAVYETGAQSEAFAGLAQRLAQVVAIRNAALPESASVRLQG